MFLFKQSFGPLQTNALLIGCPTTKKAAAIDPAMGSASVLLATAEANGFVIQKILLTHTHWDHIADVAALKKATQAPVWVHPLDAENLRHPGSDRLPLWTSIEPVEPDGFFSEGQEVTIGHLKIQVIHTPGHCPGSVCFYFKEQGILISGDTLFKGTMGALHLPTAEAEKMGPSLQKLALLPAGTRVIPGHGEETTIGKESWLQRIDQI